jgi:hypothetical protein
MYYTIIRGSQKRTFSDDEDPIETDHFSFHTCPILQQGTIETDSLDCRQ